MKDKLSFLFSVVCLWGVILVSGCSEKDDPPASLTLKEGTQTTQVVYADQVTNQGGIGFTALSDWTATVTEVVTEAMTKAVSGKVEWLELSAYSGGPGEYTLTLTLVENLTGKDRKASIEIRCGTDVITITVEQKATTEKGETPAPKEKRLVRYEFTDASSLYPDSYSKSIGELTYNEDGRLATLTISYRGDEQGYLAGRIYQFTYQENQMWIDRKALTEYESDESYVITLNSEGYVSQLYKKKESSSEQHTLWMFIYSDGYLQQIQEDYDYYPDDHENGDEEDGNVVIGPGVSSGRMGRASDRSILQLNWQNGNLMSTEGEFSNESYMDYTYTEYPNVTPCFDFNVVVRPLFGSHTYEYDDMVSLLYMLRMMGKGSKNLVTKDVVDWGYHMPEPGEQEVIHEDTWAPFAYSFTEDNYLDVVTGRCTFYSYQLDEYGNHVSESTYYQNDEYRFVYE